MPTPQHPKPGSQVHTRGHASTELAKAGQHLSNTAAAKQGIGFNSFSSYLGGKPFLLLSLLMIKLLPVSSKGAFVFKAIQPMVLA